MLLRNSAFFPVEYFSVSFYQANDFSEKKKKKNWVWKVCFKILCLTYNQSDLHHNGHLDRRVKKHLF